MTYISKNGAEYKVMSKYEFTRILEDAIVSYRESLEDDERTAVVQQLIEDLTE